ncbi:MAG: rod shape-determining protein MreC [Clostridiales bacterium]|nr:rod shape-determining protein MreC [Clostridiales bacterium]
MKNIFKSTRFKIVLSAAALLLAGMLLAAVNGSGATAQSSVLGTIFYPAHYVASKLSEGLDHVFKNASGESRYEEEMNSLRLQISQLQSQLADYNDIKNENELYKEFLDIKEENPDYTFTECTVTARDSADVYGSFTLDKGSASGIEKGDAVLYGQQLIGVVDKVYPTYSVCITILDPDFSCSAYEIVSGETSYVTGDSGLAADGTTKFANLAADSSVAYGSVICTAGIGGSFPRGLVIGTVTETKEEEVNISTYAVVQPGVDISSVSSCFVLTGFSPDGE